MKSLVILLLLVIFVFVVIKYVNMNQECPPPIIKFRYIPKTFDIEIDGTSFQKEAWIVCIANSSQYGNGAIISPESSIDDGILDFCTIQRPNLLQAPFFIARFFTGSLHKSSLIDSELGKSFLIKNNFELFHKDGEPIISNKELNIQINPLSLKVLVPNNYG